MTTNLENHTNGYIVLISTVIERSIGPNFEGIPTTNFLSRFDKNPLKMVFSSQMT